MRAIVLAVATVLSVQAQAQTPEYKCSEAEREKISKRADNEISDATAALRNRMYKMGELMDGTRGAELMEEVIQSYVQGNDDRDKEAEKFLYNGTKGPESLDVFTRYEALAQNPAATCEQIDSAVKVLSKSIVATLNNVASIYEIAGRLDKSKTDAKAQTAEQGIAFLNQVLGCFEIAPLNLKIVNNEAIGMTEALKTMQLLTNKLGIAKFYPTSSISSMLASYIAQKEIPAQNACPVIVREATRVAGIVQRHETTMIKLWDETSKAIK